MHWVFMRFAVSPFNSLLVTFGITVIIESCIQWIWTADYRRLESHYAEVKFRLGALYVPLPELLTLIAALVLCGAVWAVLRLTDLGKALRAAGCKCDHVFVNFYYNIFPEGAKLLDEMGVKMHALATFQDVLGVARAANTFDTKMLGEVEKFINDPRGWSKAHGGTAGAGGE